MARKTRMGSLYKRGKVYWLKYQVDGISIRQSLETSEEDEAKRKQREIMRPLATVARADALAMVQARLADANAERAAQEEASNPPLRVDDAWLAYERAGNRREISAGTLRNYESYWSAFTRWLSASHPEIELLRDVSFEVCEDYRAHMIGSKLTGRTINAHRAFLRAFWNVLQDKARLHSEYTLSNGSITRNPWAKLSKRDEKSIGRRPLTVDELRRVCQGAEGELRTLLALGLYLGCRMGDAACLEWGQVDMERKLVRYVPRKTAHKTPDALHIPLHPHLFAVLNEIPVAKRKGYVNPEMARRYIDHGQSYVSILVQKHFRSCGIETAGNRPGAGIRQPVAAGFHSLRHTAISLLREAGAAQSISQALVGHRSAEVHALYSHADEAALRRAVATLPNVLGGDAQQKTVPEPPRRAALPAPKQRGKQAEAKAKPWPEKPTEEQKAAARVLMPFLLQWITWTDGRQHAQVYDDIQRVFRSV